MPRLRRLSGLCSSNVSDTANRLRKIRKKESSVVPLFRSGRRSLVCARLGSKGKVGVQRGRETAGVPSFLPPRRAPRRSRRPQTANPPAEVQRKTLRPLGANTLTQFAHPGQPVQKKSRPLGANTLTQFAHPAQPVQTRSRPERVNPPAAVRVPQSAGAEKKPPRQGEHAHAVRTPRKAACRKTRLCSG